MAKKLIRSRNVVFLEYHMVGDAVNNDESQSSLKIYNILTSVYPLVVNDDHEGAGEDNNEEFG